MLADLAPRKLSEWFEQALDDLVACSMDPRYTLDMGVWHLGANFSPHSEAYGPVRSGQTCVVCLAGSLLAQSFKAEPTRTYDVLGPEVSLCLSHLMSALNDLRRGNIQDGICTASFSDLVTPRATLLRLAADDRLDVRMGDLASRPAFQTSPAGCFAYGAGAAELPQFLHSMQQVLAVLKRLKV